MIKQNQKKDAAAGGESSLDHAKDFSKIADFFLQIADGIKSTAEGMKAYFEAQQHSTNALTSGDKKNNLNVVEKKSPQVSKVHEKVETIAKRQMDKQPHQKNNVPSFTAQSLVKNTQKSAAAVHGEIKEKKQLETPKKQTVNKKMTIGRVEIEKESSSSSSSSSDDETKVDVKKVAKAAELPKKVEEDSSSDSSSSSSSDESPAPIVEQKKALPASSKPKVAAEKKVQPAAAPAANDDSSTDSSSSDSSDVDSMPKSKAMKTVESKAPKGTPKDESHSDDSSTDSSSSDSSEEIPKVTQTADKQKPVSKASGKKEEEKKEDSDSDSSSSGYEELDEAEKKVAPPAADDSQNEKPGNKKFKKIENSSTPQQNNRFDSSGQRSGGKFQDRGGKFQKRGGNDNFVQKSKAKFGNDKFNGSRQNGGNRSFNASFESKNDSYGKPANDHLKNLRGKDFAKEMNKKKRGNYTGGRINTSTNSIKFEE